MAQTHGFRKKYLLFGFKWFLGLAIIALLLNRVEISTLRWAIGSTDLGLVVAGLILALAGRLLLAWQTQIVVTAVDVPITVKRAFIINLATAFYGLMLPGDLSAGAVRWYKLSQPSGRRVEVFAAILFQRLVNTLLILVLGLTAFMVDFPLPRNRLLLISILLIAGAAVLMSIIFSMRFDHAVFSRLGGPLRKTPTGFRIRIEKIWKAFISYRHIPKRLLAIVFLLAAGDAFLSIILFFVTSAALNLDLPISALIWIRSLVLLIQLIPASMSGLGLREGALVILLPYYGVAPADALCFSLIIFGYTLFFSLLGGLLEARASLRLKK